MKAALPFLFCASVLTTVSTTALSVGQIDDFEDGTTQGWVANLLNQGPNFALPQNALGGRGGPQDNYLLLTSLGGQGPASHLSAINLLQWAGNYLGSGIQSISMDVHNFSQTDLYLRVGFADPQNAPPENVAFSKEAILVPAGSGWMNISFPIGPDELLAAAGSIEEALMNATEMRIYHSPDANFPNPVFPIPAIIATLGIDNITAAVPDTGSNLQLAVLAVAIGVALRRRGIRPGPAVIR